MQNEVLDHPNFLEALDALRNVLKKDFYNNITAAQRECLFHAFKENFKSEEDVLNFQGKILNKIKKIPRDAQNPYFSDEGVPSPQSALSFILNINFKVLNAKEHKVKAFLAGFEDAKIKPAVNVTQLTYKERYWKFCQRHPFLIAASIAVISTTLLLGGFVSFGASLLLLPPFLSLTAGIFFSLGLGIASNLIFTGSVGTIIRKISGVVLHKMASQAEKRDEMTVTPSLKAILNALEAHVIQKSPKDQRHAAYLSKADRESFSHLIVKFTTFQNHIPKTTPLIQSKLYTLRY